jgi:1,2-diacylglycerol 3-beta-galactosyltransferase
MQALFSSSCSQIDVCDIWTHYTPWPCNQLPKSYSFMVKYSVLWRLKWV